MIKKLWPARQKHIDESLVADLDAIVAESVPFRFKGKIHYLKPFTLSEYLKFVSAKGSLEAAATGKDPLTARGLAEQYHGLISSVCDTITIDDILEMEQVQIAALYQLVIDMVTGQVDQGEGKKKRFRLDLYASAQASSLPNAQESSDGTQGPH